MSRPRVRIPGPASLPWTVLALALAAGAGADEPSLLAARLQSLGRPGPAAVALRLELEAERTSRGHTAQGKASVRVEVDLDPAALQVRWDPALLHEADAEEHARDQDPARLTPTRDALRELEPARIAHLLDQAGTLAGLTRGKPVENVPETVEGRPLHRLAYAFRPRLSWTESYYLKQAEGRFTVWIDDEGTPLRSESLATYEGKTSRTFGRFKGQTRVDTRYALDDGRLRVAERRAEETRSHDDGAEVERSLMRFAIDPR